MMQKRWILFLLMVGLLITACSPASTPAVNTAVPEASTEPVSSPTQATQTGAVSTQDASAPQMTCQVVSLSPTQGPTESSMFPPVTESDWILGKYNPNATLTVLEYSDFQCPYCAQLAPVLEEFYKAHPDDVQVAFRYFPLPGHSLALRGAAAAEAAGMQGKFWEMHDALFGNQGDWASLTADEFDQWLEKEADTLQLDKAKFVEDMNSQAVVDKVQAAQKHGEDIGIPGTPTVLLNGQYYQGPRDLASYESILEMFKLKDRQFTYCPPSQIDLSKQYTATIKTEKGDIVIQLYPDKAPMAVNSFVFLARQGWFDNITFHRVLADFVAQTGDPSGTGYGGPGYTFADEISDLKFDKEGVVAMANSGANTNGSQFFITLAANDQLSQLDGKYTIFGQVIEGMDIVKQLTPRDPSQSSDLPAGDKILTVEIQEK